MSQPESFAIRFAPQTLDYVVTRLAQCPYSEVAMLLQDIQRQVAEQRLGANPLPPIDEAQPASTAVN